MMSETEARLSPVIAASTALVSARFVRNSSKTCPRLLARSISWILAKVFVDTVVVYIPSARCRRRHFRSLRDHRTVTSRTDGRLFRLTRTEGCAIILTGGRNQQ